MKYIFLILLAFPLVVSCSSSGDDDTGGTETPTQNPGDDDVTGDDDTSVGDDDATVGDDDVTVGDDDTSGDDDITSGDDDASGDDDVTSGDDDTTGDDDATGDDDVSPTPPLLTVATIQDLRDLAEPLAHNEILTVDLRVEDAIVTYINDRKNFFIQQRAGAGIFVYVFADSSTLCGGLTEGDQLNFEVLEIKNYREEIEITRLNCLEKTATGQTIPPKDVSEPGLTQDVVGQSVMARGEIAAIEDKLLTLQTGTAEILVYDNAGGLFSDFKVSDKVQVQGPVIQYNDLLEIKIDNRSGEIRLDEGTDTPVPETPGPDTPTPPSATATPIPSTPTPGSIQDLRDLAGALSDPESTQVDVTVMDAIVTYVDQQNRFYIQDLDGAGIYVYLFTNSAGLCEGLSVGDQFNLHATEVKKYNGELEVTAMTCLEKTGTGKSVPPIDVSETGITQDIIGRSALVTGSIAAIDTKWYRLTANDNQVSVYDVDSNKFDGFSVGDYVTVTGPLVQYQQYLQFQIDPAMGTVQAAEPPEEDLLPYYRGLDLDLPSGDFKLALHDLIDDHTVVSNAYTFFAAADIDVLGCTGATIGDIYSSFCWTPDTQKCGNFDSEGDCYNQEHTWPKSWVNDDAVLGSDLHVLFPTDGQINSMRSSRPFAVVNKLLTYSSSSNGSLWGYGDPSANGGYDGQAFEPIDDVKGDLARVYFYISVRYYTEDGAWDSSSATIGASIEPWQENLLRAWNVADPVSQKELDRNEKVYARQGNRNPFVDYPEWVDKISDF